MISAATVLETGIVLKPARRSRGREFISSLSGESTDVSVDGEQADMCGPLAQNMEKAAIRLRSTLEMLRLRSG